MIEFFLEIDEPVDELLLLGTEGFDGQPVANTSVGGAANHHGLLIQHLSVRHAHQQRRKKKKKNRRKIQQVGNLFLFGLRECVAAVVVAAAAAAIVVVAVVVVGAADVAGGGWP